MKPGSVTGILVPENTDEIDAIAGAFESGKVVVLTEISGEVVVCLPIRCSVPEGGHSYMLSEMEQVSAEA